LLDGTGFRWFERRWSNRFLHELRCVSRCYSRELSGSSAYSKLASLRTGGLQILFDAQDGYWWTIGLASGRDCALPGG
jgi:hypothetical protein